MKSFKALLLSFFVSVSAFATQPGKTNRLEDLIKQAHSANGRRNSESERTIAIDVMKNTLRQIVNMRKDNVKGLEEGTINVLADKALVMSETTAKAFIDLLGKDATVDGSLLNDFIRSVESDNDAKGVLLIHNLRNASKQSAKDFVVEVRKLVRDGMRIEDAVIKAMEKYGTQEAKKLPFDEILKRCKDVLGLA